MNGNTLAVLQKLLYDHPLIDVPTQAEERLFQMLGFVDGQSAYRSSSDNSRVRSSSNVSNHCVYPLSEKKRYRTIRYCSDRRPDLRISVS